jgi:predicted nucleic acid-binding protein
MSDVTFILSLGLTKVTDIFLDTSYAIALVSKRDRHHVAAREWAARLCHEQTKLVTTDIILVEIGNSLSSVSLRHAAVLLLQEMLNDPSITIVHVSPDLFAEALDLFIRTEDKSWGLADCISFIVMRKYEITDALTADHHFQQFGCNALLLQ